MYKNAPKPTSILIVKTSSLGDIIQAFNVLNDLKRRFPEASIDWAVEVSFHSIVAAHPLVRRAIPLAIKERRHLWDSLRSLRREKYDLIFDLQANCKSGMITFLSRGKVKVGYGLKAVREWPNVLATHVRFNVSKKKNIRHFYLDLIEHYCESARKAEIEGVRFKISDEEKRKVDQILAPIQSPLKIMVCPASKWINKQLPLEVLVSLLQKIEQTYHASFLLVWGAESEKAFCQQIQTHLSQALIVDKLPLPTWQNLMSEVDLVIAVDSSALHLCGTTATPSFSLFGPTSPHVFKPIGERHFSYQGACPYGRTFEKQCPILRSCSTGACMRELRAEDLFLEFTKWTSKVLQNQCGSPQF